MFKSHLSNISWYVLFIALSIVGYILLPKDFPAIVFILIQYTLLFFFIHNIFYIWIANKSKSDCNKNDLYSSWGRIKVIRNINNYFEEVNAKKFRIIVKLNYIFPISVIIVFILYLYFY